MAPLDLRDELAEIAATHARLAARARGEGPDAAPTPAEQQRSVELAEKREAEHPRPDADVSVPIDPAELPAPMGPRREVRAELERRARLRNTIEFYGPNGTKRAYRLRRSGEFR